MHVIMHQLYAHTVYNHTAQYTRPQVVMTPLYSVSMMPPQMTPHPSPKLCSLELLQSADISYITMETQG